MGVLLAHALDQLILQMPAVGDCFHRGVENIEVGHIEDKALADQLKALCREHQALADEGVIYLADALYARLHDLLIPVRTLTDTIHVLIIIELAGRAVGMVLDDGEGHIGLERFELAAEIGEGDNAVGDQEILVAAVEIVVLKFTHAIRLIAVFAV